MNDLAQLVQELRASRDPQARREVIRALIEIGAPAVAPLMEALQARNQGVRRAAVLALGSLGDARAVLPLLEILQEKADARVFALESEEEESVRAAAARALGRIGDARALPGLIAVLGDEYGTIRHEASEALIKMGAPAFSALLQALEHPSFEVRQEAARTLGKIGDPAALPALSAALKRASFGTRRAAVEALHALGDVRAVPTLLAALKDRDAEVREEAAVALATLITPGDAAAVPALSEALKDQSWRVRARAIRALDTIGDVRAVPALVQALKDREEWSVRRDAAAALARLASRHPVPELRAALPILRRLLRGWPSGDEAEAYRAALARIEEATAPAGDLPLPAAAPAPEGDDLPLPAAGNGADGERVQ